MSGNAADAVSSLLEQYQAKLGNVAPKAVGIQLALVRWRVAATVVVFD